MMICKWMKFVELCGHLKKCSPIQDWLPPVGDWLAQNVGPLRVGVSQKRKNEDMTTIFPCRGWNSTSGTSRDLGTFGGKLCSKGSLQMDWYFVFWKPFPRNDLQQKFRTLEVGVGSFRWRNQKRKEKGLQENPYLYLLRGETLGMC